MEDIQTFATSVSVKDEILSKEKKVSKGSTLAESGIEHIWMM